MAKNMRTVAAPSYFFRIKKVQDLVKDTYWPVYQVEVVGVHHGRVSLRKLLFKPDTLQMCMSKMEEMIDPKGGLSLEEVINAKTA